MPKQPMKLALVIAITLYAAIGASFGAALCAVMPAVNFWGGAYVALTWPTWIKGSPVELHIPNWAFTFKDQGGEGHG